MLTFNYQDVSLGSSEEYCGKIYELWNQTVLAFHLSSMDK